MSNPTPLHDRDGKIWMDGQLVDWRDAKVHVLTHTMHYGCGTFEGLRAYKTDKGTAIFRLQEHTDRLFNSAKILRMAIPFTKSRSMRHSAKWCAATSLKAATSARWHGWGLKNLVSAPKATKCT